MTKYIGLFLASLATLMLEILLTRVFSVVTWYYFAFFAVSVAMFGFTVGALIVYLFKGYFEEALLDKRLALFSLLLGVSIDISLMVFLSIPFFPRLTGTGVFSTLFAYLAISIPFICSGVVVCICLTRFRGRTSQFYAADLIGAGIGAFLIFPVLNVMDAPTAVFLSGAVAALAAVFFSGRDMGLKRISSFVFIVLTGLMLLNFLFQPIRIEWVKMSYNRPEAEAWNAFSRIAVYPFRVVKTPYSWGLSSEYKKDRIIGERMIDIDGVSETVMTMFNGDFKTVEHLKYDVTFIAHYLKDNAKVFVIGVGGGRDILAAKAFGQKEVTGAEINNRTVELITDFFADFTGGLHRLPGVRIIADEARSVITRSDERFDIIQASCIATWSATTAGAFTLAENSLYTVEAWKVFLVHLNPEGVLSFNRWYSPDYPAQLLRLASLASYTLKTLGVHDPSRHIAVVRNVPEKASIMPSATILVSRKPFSDEMLKRLSDASKRLNFKMEFFPAEGAANNSLFKEAIDRAGDSDFHSSTMLDLSPTTDERPFFFYMLKLRDAFGAGALKFDEQRFSVEGIMMLFILFAVSIVLCIAFIIGPLAYLRLKKRLPPLPLRHGAAALLFFSSIGFGYILVEMGLMQRLIIFLGHPVYSITVVLFSMLLSSGLGAIASARLMRKGLPSGSLIAVLLLVLIGMLAFTLFFQTGVLSAFEKGGIVTRVAVSLLFLVPPGFMMGMPFPFGMSISQKILGEHTAWLWAANGATSVLSSVLAVCVSIVWGFSATIALGLGFYVSATLALIVLSRLASGGR